MSLSYTQFFIYYPITFNIISISLNISSQIFHNLALPTSLGPIGPHFLVSCPPDIFSVLQNMQFSHTSSLCKTFSPICQKIPFYSSCDELLLIIPQNLVMMSGNQGLLLGSAQSMLLPLTECWYLFSLSSPSPRTSLLAILSLYLYPWIQLSSCNVSVVNSGF